MGNGNSLEQRVEDLARQMQALSHKVELLEVQLAKAPEVRPAPLQPAQTKTAPISHADTSAEPEDVSEEILSWAHRASLLPRLATS